MKSTELHIMMKQLINNQGASFIADKRFANILFDMGCFTNFPKGKNILKTINEKEYANRILSYMDGYEPKDEIFNTMFDELSSQYNYAKNDISYFIQCILYGLNILDSIEKYSTKLDYGFLEQLEEFYNVAQEEVDAWNTEYCVLNITPTNADVFVDGRRIKHDDEPIVLELSCGEHKIKVSSPMYYAHEDSFIVSESQENSLSIELKPQFGSILVMTNAKESMVYIDDVELGIAPVSMEKLASGTHTLRIEDALHKKYEEVFVMNDGQRLEMDIKMEANFGEVVLCTDDKKLQVYIDGQYQGNGAWKGQLPIGHHSIECKKESHFSKTLDVFVKLGDETINTFTLPTLEAYYGCLKVNVKPVGSTVYLDGIEIGKSPLKYRNALTGKHVLKIIEEGGNIIEKEIDIKEGIITVVDEAIPLIFFKDYDKAEIGDYFYIDGTLSHQKSKKKKAVGIVFTLETTEEEKKHGWTHGQIIALDNARTWCEWSKEDTIYNKELPLYKEQNWDIVAKDKDGYKYSHLNSVRNNSKYTAFSMAEKYNSEIKLPETTSGWYLPTIGQWNDVLINLFQTQIKFSLNRLISVAHISDIRRKLNISESNKLSESDFFWVTNLGERNGAWTIKVSWNAFIETNCPLYTRYRIRTVAAF